MLPQRTMSYDIVNWSFDKIALTWNNCARPAFPCEAVETIRSQIRQWKAAARDQELRRLCRQASLQASNEPSSCTAIWATGDPVYEAPTGQNQCAARIPLCSVNAAEAAQQHAACYGARRCAVSFRILHLMVGQGLITVLHSCMFLRESSRAHARAQC